MEPFDPSIDAYGLHRTPYETVLAMWDELDLIDKLVAIKNEFPPSEWLGNQALPVLATFYTLNKAAWADAKRRATEIGLNPYDLEQAVRQVAQTTDAHASEDGSYLEVTTLDTVIPEDAQWFWWPYIPLQALTMVNGDPGIGKGLFTTALASHLSRGAPLPTQQGDLSLPLHPLGDTLFLSVEDDKRVVIRPRIDRCHGDPARIHVIDGRRDNDHVLRAFTFAHMPLLRTAVAQYHPRLVVIDPIHAYIDGKTDTHRSNEVIPLLEALTGLAREFDCALLAINHQGKGSGQQGGKAMMRGLGSVSFTGSARSVLTLEQHPVHATQALLCHSKSNLGALGRTQIFGKDEGAFTWQGVTRLDAETIAGDRRSPGPSAYAFFDAYFMLETRLQGGIPVPAPDILVQLEEDGYKRDTVYRAKKALGVESRLCAGVWMWRLPDLSILSPPRSITSSTFASSSVTTASPASSVSTVPQPKEGVLPLSIDTVSKINIISTLSTLSTDSVANTMSYDINALDAADPEGMPKEEIPEVSGAFVRCPHCESDAVHFFKGTKGVCYACGKQSDWKEPR